MAPGVRWRDGDSVTELGARLARETAVDLRLRWQALWLLRQGYARRAVVQALGVHPRTLCAWVAWYQTGGCAEVARHRLGAGNGQTCRLTDEQLAELAAWAGDGLFYTYADARQWVEEAWGVAYSYDGIRSLLNRIGIAPRVPRPLAGQADLDAQDAWKRGACRRRLQPTRPRRSRGWAGAMSSASASWARPAACSPPEG